MKRMFFALFVVAIATACSRGSSPTWPTTTTPPLTCQDQNHKVTNFGGPLPCEYAESYVMLNRTNPAPGATLNAFVCPLNQFCSTDPADSVYAYVSWGISQADWDEAKRNGDDIYVTACLSVDGTTIVGRRPGDEGGGACFPVRLSTGETHRETEHHLSVSRNFSDATQTNYIIVWLEWRTQGNRTRSIFQRESPPAPAVFHWK